MYVGLILEMAVASMPDRTAVTVGAENLSYADLDARSRAAATWFKKSDAASVVFVGGNSAAYPVALFGAARSGIPFVPLNYRLGAAQLEEQIGGQPGAVVIRDQPVAGESGGAESTPTADFLDLTRQAAPEVDDVADPDAVAVLLHTSGTSAAPKIVVLRHRHLMSYLISTVEFASSDPDEAALISVPPYHIAGTANLLSNLYSGRRIVYLDRFDPGRWLDTVRQESITHTMVIPTMLARVVNHLGEGNDAGTPSLRSLSYGGSRIPLPVLKRALEVFPTADFVNAYGLTETSSTIALLGPEEHRAALLADDPVAARRLESVGRLLPTVELEIRDDQGNPLPPGEPGLIFVRGEQVAGEYRHAPAVDAEGWFATRDRGWVDADGYLFIEGRSDDTIIRGGENIAPAEIEDVLLTHPRVTDAVVVGLPDEEWGQRLAAVVVLADPAAGQAAVSDTELRQWVRERLRTSKTPDTIDVWPDIPRTDTGKVVRREVVARLSD